MPIKVSKHRLVDRPEQDQVTQYNYIEDNHVFETEGATLKYLIKHLLSNNFSFLNFATELFILLVTQKIICHSY